MALRDNFRDNPPSFPDPPVYQPSAGWPTCAICKGPQVGVFYAGVTTEGCLNPDCPIFMRYVEAIRHVYYPGSEHMLRVWEQVRSYADPRHERRHVARA